MSQSIAFLIPAYRPSDQLVDLVLNLSEKSNHAYIFVVDDGCSADYQSIFKRISQIKNTIVIKHATNLGKGGALKTGLNRAFAEYPDLKGVVTLDADGQHRVEDALTIADSLLRQNALIIGARVFNLEQVPWRSRFGNTTTRRVFLLITGLKLTDTQSGLRGIPKHLALKCLKIKSLGYEFETDMLLLCSRQNLKIVEVPIETIYIDNNSTSHFNPILDSLRIYFVLVRFTLSAIFTSLLDSSVFAVVFYSTGQILTSTIVGRAVAMVFNFITSKYAVFKSSQNFKLELLKYVGLVLFLGFISNIVIKWVTTHLTISVMTAKIIVETALFPISFAAQRLFVFTPKPGESEAS